MPKKASKKVQFEITRFTVEQEEDGAWTMRIVQEGYLDGLSDVAGAIEEAKAQAPNVVVAPLGASGRHGDTGPAPDGHRGSGQRHEVPRLRDGI